MAKTVLDYWDKNSIFCEVEVVKEIRVAQYRVSCEWCGTPWLVVIDRTVHEIIGRMLCSHCGEFFRWELLPTSGATRSFRIRAVGLVPQKEPRQWPARSDTVESLATP